MRRLYRSEKEKRRKSDGNERRDRGVGGPSVGKWKGGMLVLGKRDVATIEGRRGRGGRGRGGIGGYA